MTKNTDRVTEPEARATYIAMKGRRSVRAVRKRLTKGRRKTPSETTFKKWCTKHEWRRLAREHDERVATGAAAKIEKAATAQVVTRAHQFDTLATDSLKIAIDGLAKIDVTALKATDIRALAEVSERASKMFELLEGRATDRTDDMSRGDLDQVLQDMQDEIKEKLDGVRRSSETTVH